VRVKRLIGGNVLLVLIARVGVYIKRKREGAMRRWLGCLLFVPTLAFAAAIASMPNEGGGKIVFAEIAGTPSVLAEAVGGKVIAGLAGGNEVEDAGAE
jgi:hypothetical protein